MGIHIIFKYWVHVMDFDYQYWINGYKELGFDENSIISAFKLRKPHEALVFLLKGPENLKNYFLSVGHSEEEIKTLSQDYVEQKAKYIPDIFTLNEEDCLNSQFFIKEKAFKKYQKNFIKDIKIKYFQSKLDATYKKQKSNPLILKNKSGNSVEDHSLIEIPAKRSINLNHEDNEEPISKASKVNESDIREEVVRNKIFEEEMQAKNNSLINENFILKHGVARLQRMVSKLSGSDRQVKKLLEENKALKLKLAGAEEEKKAMRAQIEELIKEKNKTLL
ncbi:unnamed protein product [Blepharisma stoltei]|uniref:Uncharacterized protein n=1 Tax=Blepharisma stoltei TaxID=1481888 RepID=A0AAU9IFL0_9CILI|nr:unnamed protein product [Blepharisma stoltei]